MERETRQTLLMESAIHVVACDGLESATTKSIAKRADLNEVYIYRSFQDKDDLLRQTFLHEDYAFVQEIINRFAALKMEKLNWEMQCRALWIGCWNYMMKRLENCLFYVRYYYSASFDSEVRKQHMEICKPLLKELNDVTEMRNLSEHNLVYLLEMTWVFSSKVALGIWKNNKETAEHCYQILHAMYLSIAVVDDLQTIA